jgi:hypothetical protein
MVATEANAANGVRRCDASQHGKASGDVRELSPACLAEHKFGGLQVCLGGSQSGPGLVRSAHCGAPRSPRHETYGTFAGRAIGILVPIIVTASRSISANSAGSVRGSFAHCHKEMSTSWSGLPVQR